MLALAQYLHAREFFVSGSDAADNHTLRQLIETGICVHIGHHPENIEDAELVVFTAAAREDNAELVEARRRGIPTIKRAELLGEICERGPTVAIAGTHGKTTTTALTGHLVRALGIDATVFAGGLTRRESGESLGPALIGSHSSFVVEADEYDRSFLYLHPDVTVVTNLEYDHPDCYESLEAMIETYSAFLQQTKRCVIAGSDSPQTQHLGDALTIPVQTFGVGGHETWSAKSLVYHAAGTEFELAREGHWGGLFRTRLLGVHNVQNALAAIAATCAFTGATPEQLRQPLASFVGTERRLEVKGTLEGVTVIDDYAHHPSEVRATLAALSVLNRPVRVIFQPHTYTRTQAFLDDFASALSAATETILLEVYAAREKPISGVDSSALLLKLRSRGASAELFEDHGQAVEYLVRTSRPGDVVVTMGAGSVTALGVAILAGLNGVPSCVP